jgi:hypothetical protein
MLGAGGARTVLGSRREILVEEKDLARAQQVLKEEDEGFDEEELARLSEEAGGRLSPAPAERTRPAGNRTRGIPYGPVNVPA